MIKLRILAVAFGLAAPLAIPAAASAEGVGSAILVELFTSQGCHSCPPADAHLGELAGRDGVAALSMHVDYWDYLGWRDSFGSRAFTKRQYGYRENFGARAVYTPQMVINGRLEAVGSRTRDVAAALEAAAAVPPVLEIAIKRDGGMLKATLMPGETRTPGIVWVARYSKSETVDISRGENRGKTLTYHNVVKSLERIGAWAGTAEETVMLPQPDPGEGVAVWVQAGETGPVHSASYYER